MVTTTESVRNAMTVDVEDYFHTDAVEAGAPHGARGRTCIPKPAAAALARLFKL